MWDTIIIEPFINLLLWISNFVGNFGVAIILFTVLTRIILYPLTAKQMKSTAAMQQLQSDKRYIEIQTKYKNDKEKLAQEQMKLYQEMKINPMASCLPTLIQFPIIIGLYQALIQTMAQGPLDLLKLTRHIYPNFLNLAEVLPLNSKFLWMDMGTPERLFIPGLNFGIPVLAIVVVITTYISTKIITPPPQPGANDQGAMMSKMMNLYMPFLMGWLAWSLQSGLALYFVTTNLIQIAQYAISGNVHWENVAFWKKQDTTKQPLSKTTTRGK
jgi:YidC/Oxa1 family membrane protein insertase